MRSKSLAGWQAALVLAALLTATSVAHGVGFVRGTMPFEFRNTAGAAVPAGWKSYRIGTSLTTVRSYTDSSYTSHAAGWLAATDLTGLADTTRWMYGMPTDWDPEALRGGTTSTDASSADSCWIGDIYFVPDGSNVANSLVASLDTIKVTFQMQADEDEFGGTPTTITGLSYTAAGLGVMNSGKGWNRAYFYMPMASVNHWSSTTPGMYMAWAPKWRIIFSGDYTGRWRAYMRYPRKVGWQQLTPPGVR